MSTPVEVADDVWRQFRQHLRQCLRDNLDRVPAWRRLLSTSYAKAIRELRNEGCITAESLSKILLVIQVANEDLEYDIFLRYEEACNLTELIERSEEPALKLRALLRFHRELAMNTPSAAANVEGDLDIERLTIFEEDEGILPTPHDLYSLSEAYRLSASQLALLSYLTAQASIPSVETTGKAHALTTRVLKPESVDQSTGRLEDDSSARLQGNEAAGKYDSRPKGSDRSVGREHAGIFISYRRADEPAFAGRLYDKLVDRFGAEQIFMDVDDIELGADFVEELETALSHCAVMIVIIGKDWLAATDPAKIRRLDDPGDFVRLEIERALARHVRVIPVLVEGAGFPHRSDLPESLASLVRKNAHFMSNARFRTDCVELVSTLERVLDKAATITHPSAEANDPNDM